MGLLGLGAVAGAVVDGGGAGRISRSAGGGVDTVEVEADFVGRGRGLLGMTEAYFLGAGCMAAILVLDQRYTAGETERGKSEL